MTSQLLTSEIRQSFLDFFKSKGHQIVHSSNLVPAGDPTLLFTNAGMVQFKDTFLGTDPKPYTRATTCQKSLRISGKHNDLENVGRTARHHTFFEMLGNFSFGDYFKEDAISYAWEFITKVLKLTPDRLWVTVYEDDEEAKKIWIEKAGVSADRILKRGKKDNFWAMGDTGPCGPCSEIFYFLGESSYVQKGSELLADDPLYVEIWNLVFMQYNRDTAGNLNPLPKPSIDTGMGLERVAAALQGKLANYDSDLLRNIIDKTATLGGVSYLGHDYTERSTREDHQYGVDVALRVVADHSRACSFLIAEGVRPSSDGRGYVLRRLIRRACRHGRVIGFKSPFLNTISKEVVSLYSDAYPELSKEKETIVKVIKDEEEKFLVTFDTGLQILETEIKELKKDNKKVLAGSEAFKLHDTYGFPLDLTQDICSSYGVTVDEEGFSQEMENQRERSRSARSNQTNLILQRSVKPYSSTFVGYTNLQYESEIVGLYDESGDISHASEGKEVAVVVKETPFYAESGGQVGDTGRITHGTGSLDVIDTLKAGGDTIVHVCRVMDGDFKVGNKVRLEVDQLRRKQISVHHSSTHILHLALREVLGPHIKQAGSRVSDTSLRFDFTHGESITDAEKDAIEEYMNRYVIKNHKVITHVLPIEDAKNIGAVALFGEKYGDIVRVVEIGENSKEFCGGVHVESSGEIGHISLISEGSVSSGIRRIEAVSGLKALSELVLLKKRMLGVSRFLQVPQSEILPRIQQMHINTRDIEAKLSKFKQSSLSQEANILAKKAKQRDAGYKVLTADIKDLTIEELRSMADNLRNQLGSSCITLATVMDGKTQILTTVSKDLSEKFHAGNLVKEINQVLGGKGGGKSDLAQAGGGDPTKLSEALKFFETLV